MLYIFQVDTGQMLNFEMDVAISTVSSLKLKIASAHGIPVEKQVLLVSGGEILEASSRVCNYAAGTDTNPIFLFNRLNIEGGGGGSFPQESTFETSSGNNVNLADLETIQKQIENTNSLPPTYMSVVTRAQLAQHIHEMGREMTRKCEVLIHHQHLQHQGWAAVVANLDDIVGVFNSKVTTFVHSYDKFVQEYSAEQVDAYVDGIDSTLKILEGIRLPGSVSSLPTQPHSPKTIVTWLSEHYGNDRTTKDSNMSSPLHGHLASLAASTRKTYDHVTAENFLQTLKQETNTVSEKASSPNMKEIKGLEERLYGLDQLLQEAKKLVVDQHELTQAFHQNVQRASNLRDSSIFPDLCASHQHQLLVMLKNHTQLEDIRRRCARAKEELTVNLNSRLKWVAFVQKNLSDQSAKLTLYNESLKRLRVNVSVLQQIHNCERVYTVYCDEVTARGRVYARLRRLARKIAEFNEVAEVENARRMEFLSNFAGHFLSQLFCVVCEDREICTVHLPKLVEYDECADDGDDSSEPVQIDTEKLELAARVKALEAQCAALQAQNFGLEETLREKSTAAEKQQEAMAQLAKEVDASKHEMECKSGAADRLGKQVADLKKLIDEFREKEDESIKLRNDEVARHEAVVAELEAKCEERVVELTRMLEFECSQKVKGIEEAHRLEFDALVNRFKLMNKSQACGGSSGDVCGSMSPGGGEHNKLVGLKRREDSRKELVFSDDETGDEDMDNVILRESTTGGNGGSLERAVDAAAALFEDQPGDPTSAAKGKEADASNFVVNEFVVTVATRLHKLSRISVDTCRVGGDANLFYWNDKFNAFTVYLATRNVHFLNSSASSAQEDDERRIKSLSHRNLFIANITDKEFCVARRPQNRYNVPQGFHFYRVKCKLVEVIDE